jgi:hypothetical protein
MDTRAGICLAGACGETTMEPEKPWRDIPKWFFDKKPASHYEVESDDSLKAYADIQKYFGGNISRRAVDEFLFGRGIKGVEVKSVESVETHFRGTLIVKARIILPSGNDGKIGHTFDKHRSQVSFDCIKPEKSVEKFPSGLGREFFERYVPALRELGIKEIEIQASSVPSSGMNGAYTWSFYGFTNRNMKDTLSKYILYLEDYHGIYLDGKRINAIIEIDRMKKLAEQKSAKEFLLGIRRGNMEWIGYIPDIHDETTVEMDELIRYLSGGK